MIIYFAELSHTGQGRSPNVVPLASGYLAAYVKKHFPDIEIEIFRDTNQLLETVKSKQPDIVSFSVYLWSERLSSFCAERIKQISKKTIVVAGGASVDDIDSELLTFLRLYPSYDICIPNEGEISFLRLIEDLKIHNELVADEIIDGCARLSSDGSLLRGAYEAPIISDIPSPYLNGFMDTFLYNGYEPIIQSMRGCPYSCAFCVSGTNLWSKIRAFDLNRIFAEFEYIKKRTQSKYLILTDENLGILKDRDVELAEYIIKSYKESGYPSKLYFYSAKIITDYVLKVVETLAPIGEFGISFQTLDEDARKEIKRTNIKYDQFLKYIQWAKERKIVSSTEMIFGFPGETVNSYIKGLEKLLQSGVDRIYSYNLRLFNGIDLSTQTNRDKYKFKTMYRLPERTFGCYDGTVVTEVEEVVVGSYSFSYDDYLVVRRYGLFLELSSGRGYLSELIRLMVKFGLPGEKIVMFLANHKFNSYPRLASMMSEYYHNVKGELFETPELCTKYFQGLIYKGMQVPEVKLNLIYTGKIMLDANARTEFFNLVKEFVRTITTTKKQVDFFEEYIDNILALQVVSFNTNEVAIIHGQTRIRVDKIDQNNYNSMDDLLTDEQISIELTLHEDAVDLIQKKPLCNINDEVTLQNLYMSISRFGLLRPRRIKLSSG